MPIKTEKFKLVVTLGEGGAPAAWHWIARVSVTDDAGAEIVSPQDREVPCTAAEAAAHIGQSAVDIQGALVAKDAQIASLVAERDGLAVRLKSSQDALNAVTQADQAWDASVRPLVAAAQ